MLINKITNEQKERVLKKNYNPVDCHYDLLVLLYKEPVTSVISVTEQGAHLATYNKLVF